MSINNSYNEETIVEAIAIALDNFYTNLIKKVDSLNIKAVTTKVFTSPAKSKTCYIKPSPVQSFFQRCHHPAVFLILFSV